MKNGWKLKVVLGWIVLMALLLFKTGIADAFDVFQVREVTVVYRIYQPGSVNPLVTQNPLLPGREIDKGLDLEINTDLLKYLYWDNTVHSLTDRSALDGSGQFRKVGLEWRLGVDLGRVWKALPLSVGWWHYSEHLLETQWGLGHFPVSEAVEIRIRLYKR